MEPEKKPQIYENDEFESLPNNNIQYIITKFARKGFPSLDLENLATAIITPNFKDYFKK